MTKIYIPLGYHCNITFLTQELKIKKETGLFEWLESKSLQFITDVINIIKKNINTDIIKGKDNDIYIINTSLYTYHYKLNEYKIIFRRRAKRFIDLIKQSDEIIFIRINPYKVNTTEEEINNFAKAIHSINPKLNIKFLLINTIDKYDSNNIKLNKNLIDNVNLLQKYFLYQDCKHDVYLRNNQTIQNLFIEYLSEFGYELEKSVNQFNPKN